MVADLVGGDHEALVLDRPRAHAAPPSDRAWSASVKAAGTVITSAPRSGEDPVELGEAQVVADAHAQLERRRRARSRRSRRPGSSVDGLGVHGAVDLDVEQVDLAVHATGSRRRARRGRWCWSPSRRPPRARTSEPATRSMPSSRGGACAPTRSPRRPGSGPRRPCARGCRARSTSRAARRARRRARRPRGRAGRPVPGYDRCLGGVELDGGCAHGDPPDGRVLIDWSVSGTRYP